MLRHSLPKPPASRAGVPACSVPFARVLRQNQTRTAELQDPGSCRFVGGSGCAIGRESSARLGPTYIRPEASFQV